MPVAQNSRRQYAYVVESVFGTTPGTPQTQLVEVADFTGELQAEQLTDPSIRSDRQVGFSRRGNLGVEGNLEVVMAPDNYDVFLEAVFQGTWTTNVLKLGTTQRSFAIEEGFMDLAQYRVFNGVTFNTMSLTVTPDQLVTGTFGFMGSGTSAFTGTSIDVSPTAITAKDKFFHEGGTITEGGTTVAYITSINLELTNNLQGSYALGSTSYRTLSSGKAEVTGTVTALFEDATLYNKFRNSTDSSLQFILSAGSPAETLTFKVPKVKYTGGSLQRAADGPVLVELQFSGVYDGTDATSLMVTRSA